MLNFGVRFLDSSSSTTTTTATNIKAAGAVDREYAIFLNIRFHFLFGFCFWPGPHEELHHVFALHWSSVLILKIVQDFFLHR